MVSYLTRLCSSPSLRLSGHQPARRPCACMLRNGTPVPYKIKRSRFYIPKARAGQYRSATGSLSSSDADYFYGIPMASVERLITGFIVSPSDNLATSRHMVADPGGGSGRALEAFSTIFQGQVTCEAQWYGACSRNRQFSITPNDACQLQPEGPRGTGETGAFFSAHTPEKKLGRTMPLWYNFLSKSPSARKESATRYGR